MKPQEMSRAFPQFGALVALRRAPAKRALALAALLCLASGCESDFDPASRISSFRVLAMASDAPFAQPGESVHLTALAHDPEGRVINWAWAACVNPDAATVEGCIKELNQHRREDGSLPVLEAGEGLSEIDYVIPADVLDGVDPEAAPLTQVGILSVACPGELREAPASAASPFECRDSAFGTKLDLHEYVVGLKRINVRQTDRNQNPTIQRILFDGSEWAPDAIPEVDACVTSDNDYDACSGRTKHEIEVVVPSSAVESGEDEFGRDYSEMVVVQHYATEGIFEDDARFFGETTTGWAARGDASGETVTFYFVVRDDRGGVSWEERQVQVR